MEEYMLPCLTKKFLGFDCMGCGLQRSFLFLVKGEFTEAFIMYPAIFPLVVLFGFLGLSQFKKIPFSDRITASLGVLSVLSILISYTYKMNLVF